MSAVVSPSLSSSRMRCNSKCKLYDIQSFHCLHYGPSGSGKSGGQSAHACFQDIVSACTLAGIHETIENLPHGYNTEIGEGGLGLSGGKKQRIYIARALLKKPKMLIFDKAVSNLDQNTAGQFAQTVNQLKGKVTILFITHMLPKGLHVDEAILLGNAPANLSQ